MNKILRITRKAIIILFSAFVILIAFLITYYILENKRLEKNDELLLKNANTRLIQSDTADIISRLPLNLIPVPQKTLIMEGFYQVPENPVYTAQDTLRDEIDAVLLKFPELKSSFSTKPGDIIISYNNDLRPEGYRLEILPGRISIEFTDMKGLHYAFVSLKVLNHNHNGLLPCAIIEDYPDLPVRGLMIDISRNKVPTFETLKKIAQLAADLKYNHLELYVEGFSFAYPSFRQFWESKETPLTGEEIRNLDAFCKSHYIDLVPNQNSMGHMADWLATEEYADLAECPDGYKFMGILDMKSTIDPSDPRSLELITKMTDDLLPNFTSDKFNVNLDEPFELGKGKSKKLVKQTGLEEVYLDYTLKIHDIARQRDKQMLMWGDIILRHPQILDKLPNDIVLLDWGYEAGYPFERNCKILRRSGIKFLLCPGTSSWTSITGRTNNMLGNIASATYNAVKYDAEGILLTDWGDMGHWQYLPVSYAGYVTGGALSWNSSSIKKLPLTSFLNSYVFEDSRHIMGQLVLDLGRYLQFEETHLPNMTTTMLSLHFGLNDRIMNNAIYERIGEGMFGLMNDFAPEMVKTYLEKMESRQPFDYSGLYAFLDEKEALLNNVMLNTSDGKLVSDEYHNALKLLRTGAELQFYIENKPELSLDQRVSRLKSISKHLSQYLEENYRLWHMRNKPGGYEKSISALLKLQKQVEAEILNYEKSSFQRNIAWLKTMIISSVSALYLKIV